jgi:hypothetical protein
MNVEAGAEIDGGTRMLPIIVQIYRRFIISRWNQPQNERLGTMFFQFTFKL